MFNLGGTPAQSKVSNRLAGNAIHTVTFKGAEMAELEGKDKTKYSILKITFANEDGEYVDTIFEPKAGDEVRKPNNFGYNNPSAIDELTFKVRHLIAGVNPAANAAIEKKGGLQINTWDQLRKFVVDNTVKAIGVETQIKLINDNKGNPRFPSFVLAFSKANELYPRTNFIGQKLAFTAKELERINTAGTAKPTNMASVDALVSDQSLELNTDDLSLDIDDI